MVREGKHLDLVHYCLIHMESYSTECHERDREFSKTVGLASRNG